MAFLLAKPTPHNVNHDNDRFSMFNKKRDIPIVVRQSIRHQTTLDRKVASRIDCRQVMFGGEGQDVIAIEGDGGAGQYR
ncbi:MAG: hypothetical protein HRJ53_00430 [Acidobacteria bacterium Pan2503]|uniref:Uncharacterized protein n=1 Tax=Candidatus Acidiferrum panamense TaxID=2741543 RepID=A0A7V8NLV0_9BACT|nr:hypothetical protein [Candidatus Acidoferrum panamensis]